MKILFLCGSLEPGKDGVGDYTRRLAGELILQGHQCGIVAIMDKEVQKTIQETQDTDHVSIPVLRLPYCRGFVLNCQEAKGWVNVFDPEWISLQYVPFSFHPKGLPFGFSNSIKQLVKGRKLHIMFHELWVGMDKEAPFKFMIWGLLQRKLVIDLLVKLSPKLINTNTDLYRLKLGKIGFNATVLPLIGNIPVLNVANILDQTQNTEIIIVNFGTLHPGVPLLHFVNVIKKYTHNTNKRVLLKLVGRTGKELEKWMSLCNEYMINIEVLGEQSSQNISKILSEATVGISTTPYFQIQKSGTVAAMKEHGLNVLNIARQWTPKGFDRFSLPSGIYEFNLENLIRCTEEPRKPSIGNSLSMLAKNFLQFISYNS